MNSKSYLYLGLAGLTILTLGSCGKTSQEKEVSATDQQVVAKINDTAIDQHRLDRFIMTMKQNQPPTQTAGSAEASPEMKKAALKQLIRIELLYQDAQAKNLVVNDEEVEKVVERIKSQFMEQDKFQKLLTESLTSEKELRDDIRRNLSIEKLIDQQIAAQVEITEEESKAFYQENKDKFDRPEGVQISHILVKLDKESSPEDEAAAKQKIEDIKRRITNGEDFAELARTNSGCPSAAKGGDLGFIRRGQTVSEFEQCAFGLDHPGQISQIIKTSFGFHILKAGQKRPVGVTPYEEVKEPIKRQLKFQKINEELENYIQKLHAEAKIESQLELDEPPVNTP